ncbi:MAG: TVP38/TMEM64 family protein [Prochlorotrichaceae cyanobacterium]|jgi:uncharacterized membrane protein YdjX (TVP38/TMEM64 family)
MISLLFWFTLSFGLTTVFPVWAMAEMITAAGIHPQLLLQDILQWINHLGAIGAIVFIGLYIVATVAFLPGSILTLGAGVVFGVVQGSCYVFIGATIGAILAFLVGRYGARGFVAQKISGNDRFKAIDRAVGKAGFQIVLLTRLSPVFPFNLLNYAYGLTQVSLKDYSLGSVGMIPGTILYVYIGSLFSNLAELFANSGERSKTPLELGLYGVGLVITVVVTLYVTQIARKALQGKISELDS